MKLTSGLLFLLLTFTTLVSNGQSIKQLKSVTKQDSKKEKVGVIYGSFVQRLGFSSGGFAQDIRIQNTETKEIFSFRVKPTFKSAKENTFCFFLKPGTYKILSYWWTESKWYGGQMFTEHIYKGVQSSSVADKLRRGEIKKEDLEQYSFVVADNSVYYLGTWHFDKELVSFTNNKEELDKTIEVEYPNLNWKEAKVEIPK
ncbi:hypothetical protein ACD591_06450 [Rufibacter glacialis]|uniref:Uncharacterized protein n=1 Tax=Rufibacter glacialis TaxID=1259555 RepID=A0A5M8QDP4_9BACT|nr:hypothetical protein [Rufibacter glacialis]KAA6433298.1 hypothetical protein FOE74_12500 [Rufibacter glacialis]GGK75649.1 hypothetical protein GCM10011405_24410 [Rufibacter glacialis]